MVGMKHCVMAMLRLATPASSKLLFVLLAGLLFALRERNLRHEACMREERERLARERMEKLRSDERSGRIRAERKLREVFLKPVIAPLTPDTNMDDAHMMYTIGELQSVYRSRNGCPRQGQVSPQAKSRLVLTSDLTGDALDGLRGCTYVWLLFVFHCNTNGGRATGQAKDQARRFRGLRLKIRPPRLGGKKVGIFSTRTPHRPNPLGLSLARLDRVDQRSRTLFLSGLDMIDGTPVLDIKVRYG